MHVYRQFSRIRKFIFYSKENDVLIEFAYENILHGNVNSIKSPNLYLRISALYYSFL